MVEGRGQKFMFFIIPQRLIKGKISVYDSGPLARKVEQKVKTTSFIVSAAATQLFDQTFLKWKLTRIYPLVLTVEMIKC